jgi:UDP-N-acetylglucosamine 3-dehydrogenase
LRVGVVGLGSMGRNHARVLAELAEVDQVVGVDASEEARQEVAHRLGIATVASIDDLPDPIDAAVVAVPSSLHRVVGEQLLLRGVACLIEKPLAPSVEDAEALIAAASRSGAVATVGHIERFNPAILELRKRLDLVGPVLGITTRRIGPYPARIQDVGVRLDLLTHDIDVVRAISGSEPETIAFVGDRFVGANEEYVLAIGRLLSGVIVSLECATCGSSGSTGPWSPTPSSKTSTSMRTPSLGSTGRRWRRSGASARGT